MKTHIIKIDPHEPNLQDIICAAKIIRQGGLVVFPTETVYGIAADASNEAAVKRLREVKQRREDKPFSLLVAQKDAVARYSHCASPFFYKLIDKYWPGPLTVVVPQKDMIGTVGLRMPDNNIALNLIREAQCGIVAPSANREGQPPPATCQEALKDLDGLVDLAIDGGQSKTGQSSTVVDITAPAPKILREGALAREEIESLHKKKSVLFICTGNSCRSVMAEYLLKEALKDRNDVEISSSGTAVVFPSGASYETLSVLKEEGIDAGGHLSRPLTVMMLKKADLIFVMTRGHRRQVLDRVPEVEKRLYLLKEFSGAQEMVDIPDPMGASHESYRQCLNIIKQAVHKIVDLI